MLTMREQINTIMLGGMHGKIKSKAAKVSQYPVLTGHSWFNDNNGCVGQILAELTEKPWYVHL